MTVSLLNIDVKISGFERQLQFFNLSLSRIDFLKFEIFFESFQSETRLFSGYLIKI